MKRLTLIQVLCFVDHAFLYNLVNKTNLVQNLCLVYLFLVFLSISTCFGRLYAHHQEKQLCVCATGYLLFCVDDSSMQEHMLLHTRHSTSSCHQQAASPVHYTASCKHSLVFLRMGEIIARKMVSWLLLSIKFVIVASSWLFILLLEKFVIHITFWHAVLPFCAVRLGWTLCLRREFWLIKEIKIYKIRNNWNLISVLQVLNL